LRRIHLFAARLAIIALLIDGLLPTAVSAAARIDATAPALPLCSAATGAPSPVKEVPALPLRHCALCAVCAAGVAGLLPSRQGDGCADRHLIGPAHTSQALSLRVVTGDIFYRAAQPRAPPATFS
jgi:hypothetical protein